MSLRKIRPLYDPNASMITLQEDSKEKDEKMIRQIKVDIVWFLQEGPYGTD